MSHKPRSVKSLLAHSNVLGRLGAELDRQQRLLAAVRELLPPPLDEHCNAARLAGERLTLETQASAWATRLRFLAPQLLRRLRVRWPRLREIRVRVRPAERPRPARRRPPPRLPAASARLLLEAAAAIEDPDLRAALERLGRSGRR